MHESNSFSSQPTTREMFKETSLLFGNEIAPQWADAQHEIGGMMESLPQLGMELVPLAAASAVPGGPVEEGTYHEILKEILERIQGQSLDGLMLSLHGAMVAEHEGDADGLTCQRVRETVGSSLPVVMTLDLHANISERMISNVTATTIYRTNPHLDQRQRGQEAAKLMAGIQEDRIRPLQALEMPPLVINIVAQRSKAEPMSHLYKALQDVIGKPGILSASIAYGYPYSDVEEMGASFLVVADGDEALAQREARGLARKAWDLREECNTVGTAVEEAVAEVARSGQAPVTLLDVGDNVGGGSPADSTIIFEAVQRAGIENALVILCDPQAVQACVRAGVGETVSLEAGGKSDRQHGEPVPIEGRVRVLHDGFFVEEEVRHGGRRFYNQGLTAVVETPEQHTVVLTSLRMPAVSLEQIRSLGVKPESKRVLIAKGVHSPVPAYEPVSVEMIAVDSPGITAADPTRFNFQHRRRPLFPFEVDAPYPDQS